jgi:hypothetical protein
MVASSATVRVLIADRTSLRSLKRAGFDVSMDEAKFFQKF